MIESYLNLIQSTRHAKWLLHLAAMDDIWKDICSMNINQVPSTFASLHCWYVWSANYCTAYLGRAHEGELCRPKRKHIRKHISRLNSV